MPAELAANIAVPQRFVTTEKDAVNLGARLAVLEPIHVVPLRLELQGADAALDALPVARWRSEEIRHHETIKS